MNTKRPIAVLSIDDHPLLSEGIATMINNQADMRLVATAATGHEGILKHREFKPDVTLMDLRLPDLSGIDAMLAIRSEFPDARIILLTMFAGDGEIQRALKAGAQAYLLKSMPADEMLETIRQVHAGKKHVPPEIASQLAEHFNEEPLSAREIDVLRHLAQGDRNRGNAALNSPRHDAKSEYEPRMRNGIRKKDQDMILKPGFFLETGFWRIAAGSVFDRKLLIKIGTDGAAERLVIGGPSDGKFVLPQLQLAARGEGIPFHPVCRFILGIVALEGERQRCVGGIFLGQLELEFV